jgi:DNA-binding response OmpR family regulator
VKKDAPGRRILIVSDSADELRSVQDLMTADLGGYWSTDDDTQALKLFAEKQPAVLILAYQEIERAERFYLTLFRQCSQIQEIPHQTLVLCKNTEAELAFTLCQSGTIDDYVVNRPLYDPFRLRLSVRQALDRRSVRQESVRLNKQLSGVGKDLDRLDAFVGNSLAAGERSQQEALKAFDDYAHRIGSHLHQLEHSLRDPALGNAIQILDHGLLSQQFDRVRQKAIEPETRRVQERLQKSGAWIRQFSEHYTERLQPLRDEPFPAALPEVMLVEDDPAYLDMLRIMLDNAGFRVITAECGEAALTELHRRRPDIMLLDYRMPGIDGVETLRRMKADPDLRNLPVIMLTAISERDVVNKSIHLGAQDFIVKPSDRDTILAKILVHLPADIAQRIAPPQQQHGHAGAASPPAAAGP